MKIEGISKLDVGMSNIEIEGKVTYEKAPRHIEGDNERGHYDFYSQFVVIDDGTGKIGCNVSIEKEEYRLEKDIMARVKGKLEEYKDKNGEMQKSLKGKLIGISKGGKETDVQLEVAEEYFDKKAKEEKKVDPSFVGKKVQEVILNRAVEKPVDKNNIWEAKDLRIARECAVKAVTELVCAKIMKSKDFFNFADSIVKYIYNGAEKETTKEEKLALARHIAEGKKGKLELREGQTGLLEDKELTEKEIAEIENAVNEKEEPGSSPDNAIPFKGKRKASKKISKASDFINNEDIIAPEDLPE